MGALIIGVLFLALLVTIPSWQLFVSLAFQGIVVPYWLRTLLILLLLAAFVSVLWTPPLNIGP